MKLSECCKLREGYDFASTCIIDVILCRIGLQDPGPGSGRENFLLCCCVSTLSSDASAGIWRFVCIIQEVTVAWISKVAYMLNMAAESSEEAATELHSWNLLFHEMSYLV